MKQTTIIRTIVGASCAVALSAFAQTSTTTTSTNPVTGTSVSETTTSDASGSFVSYTPGVDYFSFRTAVGAEPTKYYYTKDTTIVDPDGHTVAWTAVRPDMPAKVTYMKVGDRIVVKNVVLTKPVVEKTTDTTTTTTVVKP